MQFKHPEILGFLLFLAIPIIIHLFQLQRFRTEAFTNIKFLREIEASSRKRKKLKDLLILASRLMALACLILAFAQPYTSDKQVGKDKEVILYLDNSFSMQARGSNGVELFQNLKSELLDDLRQSRTRYHLITNQHIQSDLDLDQLKKEMLRMNYAPMAKPLEQVVLESEQIIKKNPFKEFEVFLLSDFNNVQQISDTLPAADASNYHLLPLTPVDRDNISLDSVWIAAQEAEEVILKTKITSYGLREPDQSIALTIGDELYGKASVSLDPGETREVSFNLPKTLYGKGKVQINDHRMSFDNELYFKLSEKNKKDVLLLGERNESLERIYSPDDFNLKVSVRGEEDQGMIQEQDLIILNGYAQLTAPMAKSLKEFVRNKGNLVIIPPVQSDAQALAKLLGTFAPINVEGSFSNEREVTGITYDHPFFAKVFKERIRNFQYPKVYSGWRFEIQDASELLTYADGSPFLLQVPISDNKVFIFSSSLAPEQTNFSRSPLIVPVFYNFSLREMDPASLYMLIGRKNQIAVALDMPSRDAARLSDGSYEFIPVQSQRENLLEITTQDFPERAGHYDILLAGKVISTAAYNFSREENNSDKEGFGKVRSALEEAEVIDSAKKAFRSINVLHKGSSLWQYFLTFALVFLMMELLIQKFFKG